VSLVQQRSEVTSPERRSSVSSAVRPFADRADGRGDEIERGVPIGRTDSRYARVVKPASDRVLATILLVIFSPIMLLVALLIRWRLGPGVLYRQQRAGLAGRPFVMYKFRTMRPDRRQRDLGPPAAERRQVHKACHDPRHTKLGRTLRQLSIDELPQLWNVVRGEMSLVGPRPELCKVVAALGLEHHPRHAVRPGVTGLWQISELRGSLLHENMHLDEQYLREISLRTDLRTLALTIPAVCGRRLGR
jgi:lipopolysaccharide/colanic/teichoic acid biosynthesis glycosyltransferase